MISLQIFTESFKEFIRNVLIPDLNGAPGLTRFAFRNLLVFINGRDLEPLIRKNIESLGNTTILNELTGIGLDGVDVAKFSNWVDTALVDGIDVVAVAKMMFPAVLSIEQSAVSRFGQSVVDGFSRNLVYNLTLEGAQEFVKILRKHESQGMRFTG